MSGPTTRVLALLELLQANTRLSGHEIAERLHVDRRTVRRYITVLETLGVPVMTEQGRYGGYSLIPGYKLPPLMFNDEETLAIVLGLLAARQLGLDDAAPAISSVEAKLERVMPEGLKRRVRSISETTRIVLPQSQARYDDKSLLVLTNGVQQERRISLVYQAPDREPLPREIDPYGLVFRRGRWYIGGYCHLRKALRTFRLDRISKVTLCPEVFTRPRDFDAAKHLSDSLNNLPGNSAVSVLIHCQPEEVVDFLGFHPCSVDMFREVENGLLMETQTDSIDWFARWLAMMPVDFTVLAPQSLKDALLDQSRRLERIAQSE